MVWKGVEELGRVVGAVNDGAAVSALGYDYVLCGVSAAVWAMGVGGTGVGEERVRG